MKKVLAVSLLFFYLLFNNPVYAQDNNVQEQYEAVVTKVVESREIEVQDREQQYQKLEIRVLEGRLKNKIITVENGNIPIANPKEFDVGEKVVIASAQIAGENTFYIVDYSRTNNLYILLFIFIFLVVAIARKKGALSILGMIISFFLIFQIVLPQILSGNNPVVIVILTSFFIIPINFYLSHGFNKKTSIAVAATIISLILTGILATFFVDFSQLSGYASEEAIYIESAKQGLLNLKGLLLAGIIIGLLGILDDITISQTSVVFQLKEVSPKISFKELYRRGMEVGRDHIASLVNTLILVYAGAAMPLLLLFVNNPAPFAKIINQEIVAEEIVRTLIASIGLILAVPLTTLLAATFVKKD